jgi:hypothetical protein
MELSNPFESNGFQDPRFQLLTHFSGFDSNSLYVLADICGSLEFDCCILVQP